MIWIVLLVLMAVAAALAVFLLKRSGRLGGGKRQTAKKNSRGQETLRYPSGKVYSRRPASEVIPDLDFEYEPAEDDDPTVDLMKDFNLNLDDFQEEPGSTPSTAERAPAESAETGSAAFNAYEVPDFGSFSEPKASEQEELPDIEVEFFEEEPEAVITPEPEEKQNDRPLQKPNKNVIPEEPVEAPRRRGKHEAPDPSDPFSDSWYQSVGLDRRDPNKK